MTETFKIEINPELMKKLFQKLDSGKILEAVDRGMFQGALNLQAWSVENRLSGPRSSVILGVVSGRLRSSVSVSRAIRQLDVKYFIGTDVKYGPTHEFGRPSKNIPARPFLKPAIENDENQTDTLNILVRNINEVLAK